MLTLWEARARRLKVWVVVQTAAMAPNWGGWSPFPDPREGGLLLAPIGPGVYELRNRVTGEPVLVGVGRNVAYRLSSLLPAPLGQGTRKNSKKREYVLENIGAIEYRCCACASEQEARSIESDRMCRVDYIFPT